VRRRALILALCGLVLAGCSGGKTVSPQPQTVEGTVPTTPEVKGDPTAGKQVFESEGCAACHTLAEAGASGSVGPNLDEGLKGKTPEFIHESIVSPDAEIAPGYPPNVMPQDYDSKLSDKQLADLVAFLNQAANG
jgi:mono/diheme cytochrome c family protein